MIYATNDIEPGMPGSVVKDVWESDLDMATEMALYDAFPMGVVGFEIARKGAERNGNREQFEQKVQTLRETIRSQLLAQRPELENPSPLLRR
jgi:hypothetical protein